MHFARFVGAYPVPFPEESLMTYLQLATVVPAFLIGTYLLGRRKGTPRHRQLGRIYLLLMMVTGLVTLFMPAQVGPRFAGITGSRC